MVRHLIRILALLAGLVLLVLVLPAVLIAQIWLQGFTGGVSCPGLACQLETWMLDILPLPVAALIVGSLAVWLAVRLSR